MAGHAGSDRPIWRDVRHAWQPRSSIGAPGAPTVPAVDDHRVAVLVPEAFSLYELGVAVEVFAVRPQLDVPWYEVRVCARRAGAVASDGGLVSATVSYGLEALDWADTVIVPEAGPLVRPVPGDVVRALCRSHARGARIVSFCTGAFVLAAAGLLDGRRATTHWAYAERLAREYSAVAVDPTALYVDDGQVLTSAGTAAGVDLSLYIVRADHGAAVARHVARMLVVPLHREGGQAQYVDVPLPDGESTHAAVRRLMEHVARNIDEDLSLARMAELSHLSPRHFARVFRQTTGTTPHRWLTAQRLARARELLEGTDESVSRIARLSGFGSAGTLRTRFAEHLGTSPSAYRQAFRGPAPAETFRALAG